MLLLLAFVSQQLSRSGQELKDPVPKTKGGMLQPSSPVCGQDLLVHEPIFGFVVLCH